MRTVLTLVTALVALAGVAGLAFLVAGPDRVWRIFGPADLGPIDFVRMERRQSPNDALALPPAFPVWHARISHRLFSQATPRL